MCIAGGDKNEAFNIIKTSRITVDRAVSRWEAMCECAKITPLAAPTPDTPLIQHIYITAAHAICEVVEQKLFGKSWRA